MTDARPVALVGFGLAGSVFHAPLIASAPRLELAAVVTRNAERAEAARRAHQGVEVEASPEAAFKRVREGGLAVIASVNDSHVELARLAIEAGIATVVDKPLAPSAAEARELVELAEARGVALTVFHNRRWDSDQLTLRRLIGEGRLGEVRRYESRFERWQPELREGAWRDAAPVEHGGGVLLDLGTHLVDQALVLFGPVRAVHGEVSSVRGGPADDDAFVALEHSSDVRSHLWTSLVCPAPGPRLRVSGSEAAFVIDALDGQEAALRAGAHPGDGRWGAEPEESWGRLVAGERSEPVASSDGDWPRFYAALAAALDGEGELPVDPRDAVTVLEVLERARRSSQ
jgi:scyllo-inositol 2-dehydrogenase (NADP+)